jgi:CRISPR-associated protein Cmr6
MQSRRDQLQEVSSQSSTHVGLWLDKYLEEQLEGGGEKPKTGHFDEVAKKPIPPAYQVFFERWQQALEQAGAVIRKAQAQGRMAIGLGGESVLETSVTLHRTYGVPYIPGSALKGLAARYARNRLDEQKWEKGSDAYKILFGDSTEAGYVTFFDALYVPGSAERDHPLALDVITVHHPEYYGGKDAAPADWDNPNPVPFLSATGSYLVALYGPGSWVKAAFEILQLALVEEGIGAKTSSGYGRMVFQTPPIAVLPERGQVHTAPPVPTDSGQAEVNAFLMELGALSQARVAPEIARFVERWRRLEVGVALKRQVAEAILARVREAGREKVSAKKSWYRELLNSLSNDTIDSAR